MTIRIQAVVVQFKLGCQQSTATVQLATNSLIFTIHSHRQNLILLLLFLFLAHQHKACRQLKIKQEMTAVGD